MASFKYYMDYRKQDKKQKIFAYYWYGGKLFKYYTRIAVKETAWNKKKQRIRTNKLKTTEKDNLHLDYLEKLIPALHKELLNKLNREPTPSELRLKIQQSLNRHNEIEDKSMLFGFIERHIQRSIGKKSEGVIKTYLATFKHLKDFAQKQDKIIDFKDITLHFHDEFTTYLIHEKKLSDNTVGNYVKNIKVFMNAATNRGLNDNLDFRDRKFKVIKKPSDSAIFLNERELDILYDMDLSDNKRLENVRDLFLVGCYTGLRYSDLIRLTPSNLTLYKNEQVISIKTQKTKELVIIPIHYRVKSILEKYNNSIPPPISIQNFNKYIKEICELAGFNEEMEVTTSRGSKTISKHLPKYKMIATHTARRSFATNAYLSGVPTYQIMLITGHKKESTFLNYIRITKKESAKELFNSAFFTGKKQ